MKIYFIISGRIYNEIGLHHLSHQKANIQILTHDSNEFVKINEFVSAGVNNSIVRRVILCLETWYEPDIHLVRLNFRKNGTRCQSKKFTKWKNL